MLSLKEFIEAMQTSWSVALAIFLGSAAALGSKLAGLPFVAALPDWVFGVAFLALFFSCAILMVSLARLLSSAISRLSAKRRRAAQNRKHIENLHHLPQSELSVLVWAASARTQVFLAPLQHSRLEPLIAKGYVRTITGQHSILDWPYIIPDHIWSSLIEEVPPQAVPNRFPFQQDY